MSYLWDDFNIKTFPAETIVYRNGEYCPELSTLPDGDIDKNYDLPVHLIFFGEFAGKKELKINVSAENQPVFVSVNVKNKFPAFLNIFIKNTGKNSEIWCDILMENMSDLEFDVIAHHLCKNTGVFVKNRLIGRENSKTKLSGTAIIATGATQCKSDITFVAMADKSAQITFAPNQRISSVPEFAGHAASIYHTTTMQTQYLRMSGLGADEITHAMRDAFIGQRLEFPLPTTVAPPSANDR